jgi:uncharacterized protein YjbJ (UPF0337 family)
VANLGTNSRPFHFLKYALPRRREAEMNWDIVAGNWKRVKGKAKQAWAKLAGGELTYMDGQSDELVGRIQLRYGIQKQSAQKQPRAGEGAV